MAFTATMALVWPLLSGVWINWSPLHTLVALTTAVSLGLGIYNGETPGVLLGMLQQTTLALFFLFGAGLLSNPSGQRQLLQITVATGSTVSAIGIAQFLTESNLGFPVVSSNASVFINKNWAGGFMDLATPAAFVLLLATIDKKFRLLTTAAFFLCVGFSLVSASRGHWLALATSLCMLLFLLRAHPKLRRQIQPTGRQQLALATVLLLTPCLLLIPHFSVSKIDSLSIVAREFNDTGGISDRIQFYRNTLAMIGDTPFSGQGPGTFYTAFQDYYATPEALTATNELVGVAHAHSDYLEYFAELGILGGLLICVLLALVWLTAWKRANEAISAEQALVGTGMLLGITAVLAHAAIDFPLSQPVPAIFFWTWAGSLSGTWTNNRRPLATAVPQNASLRTPLLLLGCIYLALVLFNAYGSLKANLLIKEAVDWTRSEACDQAIPATHAARTLSPDSYLIWHHHLLILEACDSDLDTRFREASSILERAPSHPYALLVRANALLLGGEYQRAAADYQTLIQRIPHRVSGYLGLANSLALQKRADEAQAYYDKADEAIRHIGTRWKTGPAVRQLADLSQRIAAKTDGRLGDMFLATVNVPQNSKLSRVSIKGSEQK